MEQDLCKAARALERIATLVKDWRYAGGQLQEERNATGSSVVKHQVTRLAMSALLMTSAVEWEVFTSPNHTGSVSYCCRQSIV